MRHKTKSGRFSQLSGGENFDPWVSGAEVVPPEHETSLKEQAVGFCHGQIASLRRLSQATTPPM